VPLIVQPQLFGLFSLLSWCQCLYYSTARSRTWCIVVLCSTLVLWGGLEAALVFALRVSASVLSLKLSPSKTSNGFVSGGRGERLLSPSPFF